MAFTPVDEALLKKCGFFDVYPDPYRTQLISLAKGVYSRLLKPSGTIPNLNIFELHLELALHGAGILNNLIADMLKAPNSKGLPPAADSWWNGVASAIPRFLVWKDWPDISS